jgi:hypothetical protein
MDHQCGLWQSTGSFRRKSIAKVVRRSTNENTPIHVCGKIPLLVDLQKVGELVISITSCPTIIILANALN